MQSLATENQHLHHQLANTKHALIEAESNVQKLEARLAQQLAAQTATRRTTYVWSNRLFQLFSEGVSKSSVGTLNTVHTLFKVLTTV